jgi:5-methylcytosine-specific restriction protein B
MTEEITSQHIVNVTMPNVWKMSHGKSNGMNDSDHQWLVDNFYISQGYPINSDEGKGQGKKFANMKTGDYFYLVRSSQIVLLGRIADDETKNVPQDKTSIPNWVMRKFETVKDISINKFQAKDVSGTEYWKPQGNSTITLIEESKLPDFEKQILTPAFNMTLTDLGINNIATNNELQPSNGQTQQLNRILYGPPGTGKTYNTVNKALEIIGEDLKGKLRPEIKAIFDAKMKEGQIVFTTFHQSMSYEDFIEGIKPLKPLVDDQFVKYDVQEGIFKRICNEAKSNFENSKNENKNKISFEIAFEKLKDEWDVNPNTVFQLKTAGNGFTIIGFTNTSIQFKKASGGTGHTLSINTLKDLYYGVRQFNLNQGVGIYYPSILDKLKSYTVSEPIETVEKSFVLIIDEINRGNVSQIFGELITLIEDDKRLGREEALEVTLPYSKEKFGVPSNLYIIGTMNTADRSVEALDAALRRRFGFEEMQPNSELIATEVVVGLEKIELRLLFNTINKRIEKLLDKDHQIGHSYFMSILSLYDLKFSFKNKIIPLLQEYFFGDYGKIGLVLGNGFFELMETNNDNIFANFDDYDASDFSERIIYKIKNISSMPDDDFISAINVLLKR